jgi:hypothetical protein
MVKKYGSELKEALQAIMNLSGATIAQLAKA